MSVDNHDVIVIGLFVGSNHSSVFLNSFFAGYGVKEYLLASLLTLQGKSVLLMERGPFIGSSCAPVTFADLKFVHFIILFHYKLPPVRIPKSQESANSK